MRIFASLDLGLERCEDRLIRGEQLDPRGETLHLPNILVEILGKPIDLGLEIQ